MQMIQQPSSSMCMSAVRSRCSTAERITGVLHLKGAEALPGWLGSRKKTFSGGPTNVPVGPPRCRQLYVEWGSPNTTDTLVIMMKISHILKCEG